MAETTLTLGGNRDEAIRLIALARALLFDDDAEMACLLLDEAIAVLTCLE